jgi:NTE family protein
MQADALEPLTMTDPTLALVLSGGGARAAYQVGFLRHLASKYPDLSPGILTGVSAGGIIASYLASQQGRFIDAIAGLTPIWRNLSIDEVFHVDTANLTSRVYRWALRLLSGGVPTAPTVRSLVDTSPLRGLLVRALDAAPDGSLTGITRRIESGRASAVALTASSYTTGQSVTWVQGSGAPRVLTWEGSQRETVGGPLTVDHVMASAALPFFFPAIEIGGAWYGDGGIRLAAPLSPAIHLGARKIIAVSTRYPRSRIEARQPAVGGYPPPAQVAGVLFNAIFLDLLDTDALRLQQLNSLINRLPPESRDGLQNIDLLVLRPSQDLGRLANEFEAQLPRAFRFLIRGLGSRETRSNDLLSLLMFQQDYIARLIDLGEADAESRSAAIDVFLSGGGHSG